MQEEIHTCVYCGAPATHQFKNGKWCCQEKRYSCPEFRHKISEKAKGVHKLIKDKYGTGRFAKGQHLELKTVRYSSRGDHVCVYCGEYADYQLKDGRWCCQPSSNSCPINRSKNAESGRKNPKKGFQKGHQINSGRPSWRRGLTEATNESVRQGAEKIRLKYQTGELVPPFKGKHHSKETLRKMRELALKTHPEQNFGHHKSYKYGDLTFLSSYEVTIATELDAHGVRWVQPKWATFQYVDQNGKKHSYTPDFYLPDYDVYLDPKNDFLIEHVNPTLGYCDVDKIRWVMEQNNVRIIILTKDQLSWDVISLLIKTA